MNKPIDQTKPIIFVLLLGLLYKELMFLAFLQPQNRYYVAKTTWPLYNDWKIIETSTSV